MDSGKASSWENASPTWKEPKNGLRERWCGDVMDRIKGVVDAVENFMKKFYACSTALEPTEASAAAAASSA